MSWHNLAEWDAHVRRRGRVLRTRMRGTHSTGIDLRRSTQKYAKRLRTSGRVRACSNIDSTHALLRRNDLERSI